MRVHFFALFTLACTAACVSSTSESGPGSAGSTSSDIGGSGGAGAAGGGGSGGSTAGAPCTMATDCGPEQGCYFDDAACTTGHCGPFSPSDCGSGVPACRCDGTVDLHTCPGYVPGTGYTRDTSCLPTTFACGTTAMCTSGTDYCATSTSPTSSQAACTPLPDACKAPSATCDCFGTETVGCICSEDAFGNFEVDCPG